MDEIALADWLTLVGIFGVAAAALYALWYRAHLVPLKHDLNGWGERVKKLELARERSDTSQVKMHELLRDTTRDVLHLTEIVGKLQANSENNGRDTQLMKEEIIGFASERFSKLSDEIGKLRTELAVVARLQEEQMEDERRRVDRERAP